MYFIICSYLKVDLLKIEREFRRRKRRSIRVRDWKSGGGHGEETPTIHDDETSNNTNETDSESDEHLKLDPSFTRFTLIITITLTALFLIIIAFIYGCNKDRLSEILQKLRKIFDHINTKIRFRS